MSSTKLWVNSGVSSWSSALDVSGGLTSKSLGTLSTGPLLSTLTDACTSLSWYVGNSL